VKNITSQKDFITAVPQSILTGFSKTDKRFLDKLESGGSTAILAVLDTNNQKKNLHIANVGDSRCVASVKGKAVALSIDHKVLHEILYNLFYYTVIVLFSYLVFSFFRILASCEYL